MDSLGLGVTECLSGLWPPPEALKALKALEARPPEGTLEALKTWVGTARELRNPQ